MTRKRAREPAAQPAPKGAARKAHAADPASRAGGPAGPPAVQSGPVPLVFVLAAMLALAAVNICIYAPVRQYAFVEVDDPVFTENPHVRAGLTWEGVSWAFSSFHGGYWIPLNWLSHMVDVQLYGMNAGAHHVTNVLLHIANSILLLWVFYRMTGSLGRSALVAGLFASHPLHVESVAWVTERKDMLSTLFWMLTLWAYAGYVRRPRWDRYLGVLLFCALGLLAKPMVVTLPFVLLLLDVWPLGRVPIGAGRPAARGEAGIGSRRSAWLRLILEKVPLLLLSAGSGVVTFVAQRQAGAVSGLTVYPLYLRVENALVSLVAYLGQTFWPAGMAVLYSFPDSVPAWRVAGACVLLAVITAAVARGARRRPYLAVGWLWYVGTLMPVIGIVQVGVQARADRFTYVPLIGVFLVAAWGMPDLLSGLPRLRRALPAAMTLAVAACAVTARSQVQYWRDNIVLWTRELDVALGMDSHRAHMALGRILFDKGRADEAIAHFSEAVRIQPEDAEGFRQLGLALAGQGRLDQAVAALEEAVRLEPGDAAAQSGLGFALSKQGKDDEAIKHLGAALRLDPGQAEAQVNLGALLMRLGKPVDALPHLAEAVRLLPESAEARYRLGLALGLLGRMDQAIDAFGAAVRLKPDSAEAHNDLGLALSDRGRADEASAHYREALRLQPGFAVVHNNLGVLLAGQGKLDEALAHFSEAVRIDPGFVQAHVNLGVALAKMGRTGEALREFQEVLRLDPGHALARRALEDLRK